MQYEISKRSHFIFNDGGVGFLLSTVDRTVRLTTMVSRCVKTHVDFWPLRNTGKLKGRSVAEK
jgi:hypothetical protein